MIVEHGGAFHAYLDRKSLVSVQIASNLIYEEITRLPYNSTHIVATQLTPNKVKEYAHMKVVTPAWVVESVHQQMLLPWRNYILRVKEIQRIDAPAVLSKGGPGEQRTLAAGIQAHHDLASDGALPSLIKQGDPSGSSSRSNAHIQASSSIFDSTEVGDDGEDTKDAGDILSLPIDVPSYAPNPSNVHAARLMQDPKWRAENTSVGKEFVATYFRRSRLHYLSMPSTFGIICHPQDLCRHLEIRTQDPG